MLEQFLSPDSLVLNERIHPTPAAPASTMLPGQSDARVQSLVFVERGTIPEGFPTVAAAERLLP